MSHEISPRASPLGTVRLLTAERRQVADGTDFSLTVRDLMRLYYRPVPVPVLFLLFLGFGRFASSARACVCAGSSDAGSMKCLIAPFVPGLATERRLAT